MQTLARANRPLHHKKTSFIVDYMKRLQAMIDEYNTGRMDVDQFFRLLFGL